MRDVVSSSVFLLSPQGILLPLPLVKSQHIIKLLVQLEKTITSIPQTVRDRVGL